MKKTYAQIVNQIEALKSEADKLRRKEIEGVVIRIKEAISSYGLTPADLGFPARAATRRKAGASKPGRKPGKRNVRFRDAAGNSWGGRGPRPRWLREAIAGGKSLQDFAV